MGVAHRREVASGPHPFRKSAVSRLVPQRKPLGQRPVSEAVPCSYRLPKPLVFNQFACLGAPSNKAETLRCCTWGAKRFFEVLPVQFVDSIPAP